MKKDKTKIRQRRRKCRHCHELYKPDPRAGKKQKYCSAPECRKASQAASWRRWHDKPENHDYCKGHYQVARTQKWRRENPKYWKNGRKKKIALLNEIPPQPAGAQDDTAYLVSDALPNEILAQPALIVGVIASLTGSTLPNEIAESSQRFLHLGHDILGTGPGKNQKGGRDDQKNYYMPTTDAASATEVQLG